MSPMKQEGRFATIDSPLGKDVLHLAGFNAVEGVSELFEFRVDVICEDHSLDFNKLLGVHCTVTVESFEKPGQERYFDGVVTEARWLGMQDDAYLYELVLRPWFWLLDKTNDCQIFAEMTIEDIIRKVFSDHGFGDFRMNLSENYPTLEHCVQYRESAFAFVSRLMEKFGVFYYFQHEMGKHTLVLCDAVSSLEPLPNRPANVGYIPAESGEFPEADHLNKWSAERQFQTGKAEYNDFDYLRPSTDLRGRSEASENYERSDFELYDYPGEYTETSDGEKLAKVALENRQAQDHRFRATGNVANVTPGYTFNLEDHPQSDQNRSYMVIRARHSIVDESYRSGDGGSSQSKYQGAYEFQFNDRPYRAEFKTPKPFVRGPQTATVVGPSGEEIHTDEHGRVKVHFHWDRYSPYDETASCWVRVGQVAAGKSWGAIMIPRIGHEVIVEFLEGNPDRPIIIGSVYNGEIKVPYDLPGNKTISGYKSNSSKGGGGYNELIFEDKKGEELVRGHAEKDLEFTIKNDETRDVGNDVTETIGNNMTVDVGSTVTFTAGTKIELKVGSNSIVIDQQGITIDGLVITVKGTATATVQSPMTTVKGDGTLTLQGGMVLIN